MVFFISQQENAVAFLVLGDRTNREEVLPFTGLIVPFPEYTVALAFNSRMSRSWTQLPQAMTVPRFCFLQGVYSIFP